METNPLHPHTHHVKTIISKFFEILLHTNAPLTQPDTSTETHSLTNPSTIDTPATTSKNRFSQKTKTTTHLPSINVT
jgi:hypothetical protein